MKKDVVRINPVAKYMHVTTRSAGAHAKSRKAQRRDSKAQLRKERWDLFRSIMLAA